MTLDEYLALARALRPDLIKKAVSYARDSLDSEEVEEAVQRTLEYGWRNHERLPTDRPNSARYYLFRTVRSKVYRIIREKQARERELVPLDIVELSDLSLNPEVILEKVAEEQRKAQLETDLHVALELLTPQQREAIEGVYFEGLGVVELAERLKVSHQAVSLRLSGAIARLRQLLGAEQQVPIDQ